MAKRNFRTYEEAKAYVQSQRIRTSIQYREWSKSGCRPVDIPSSPSKHYKNSGWVNCGEFFGTGNIHKGDFLSYVEAKTLVQNLNISTSSNYILLVKSEGRPKGLPFEPHVIYRNSGWKNWGDFLGTGSVANFNKEFLPFDEARSFVQGEHFLTVNDYREWSKSENKPFNIPASPDITYKNSGWKNWGDYLGSQVVSNLNRDYLTFEEAKSVIQGMGIRSWSEFKVLSKSGLKPENIPYDLHIIYKNSGWDGASDFFGKNRFSKTKMRSYEEAKIFIRSLEIRNRKEYTEWAKGKDRPMDIPCDPYSAYKNYGWKGMDDYLGVVNVRNHNATVRFFTELRPYFPFLNATIAFTMLANSGYLTTTGKTAKIAVDRLADMLGEPDLVKRSKLENALIKIIDEANGVTESESDLEWDDITSTEFKDSDLTTPDCIGTIESAAKKNSNAVIAACKAIDGISRLPGFVCNEDIMKFMVKFSVDLIWKNIFDREANGNKEVTEAFDLALVERLHKEHGGEYFKKIREGFIKQHQGSNQKFKLPGCYAFKDHNGFPSPPTQMQRLIAYLVKKEKRIGNWSGTGTGKTLSAILAAQYIGAKRIVVIAPNPIIGDWKTNIENSYANGGVKTHTNKFKDMPASQHVPHYLIYNYDFFSDNSNAAKNIRFIIDECKPDFVILDEVQMVKQRSEKKTSQRRSNIEAMMANAAASNPNLHVLTMSATPVINDLQEAKSVVEITTGLSHSEVCTNRSATGRNEMAMNAHMVLSGIRLRAQKYAEVQEIKHRIDIGQDPFPTVDWPKINKAFLKHKLPYILENIVPGTIIYTWYVDDIVEPLRREIEKYHSVTVKTGTIKGNIKDFISGNTDVLIGSQTIATGVDGLQHRAKRIIMLDLPFTSAEYQQLIGRVHRFGFKGDRIEVLIPQIFYRNGTSHDVTLYNMMDRKVSLTNMVMDGMIPSRYKVALESQEDEFVEVRRMALEKAVKNLILRDDEIIREPIAIPLPQPIEAEKIERRKREFWTHGHSDFKCMNQMIGSSLSDNIHAKFKANPEQWHYYHDEYQRHRASWKEVPFEEIAKDERIRKRPEWVIGDFGCGRADLSKLLPNKMYCFDHVAVNDSVIACNMKDTGLESEILDVAVFSLSLMGRDYADYLTEAYRLLRSGGYLIIADNRIEKKDEIMGVLKERGFDVLEPTVSDRFIYIRGIK